MRGLCRSISALEAALQKAWERLRDAALWQHPFWPVLSWLATASTGVALVYWAGVRWGPGATTDGLIYLTVARNIRLLGRAVVLKPGYRWETVTLWPPGYPLAIAAFLPLARWLYPHLPQGLFLPAEVAARAAWLLHMVMLALLVALVIRETYRATVHPFPTAGIALLAATAFPVLRMYTWVHSETVFLVQLFLAAWALQAWIARPSPLRAVLAGLLVAWAVSVRWVGVAMAPWMLTAYLLQRRGRLSRTWKETLAFLLAAGLPITGLVVATVLASGTVTGRTPGWYPPTRADWLRAARTVAEWVLPPFLKLSEGAWFLRSLAVLTGALGIILAGVKAAPGHARSKSRPTAFFLEWSTWVGWYWVTFLASKTIFEPKVEIKLRLLTPVYLPLLLMVGVAAWYLARERWWAVPLLVLAWMHMLRTARVYDGFYIRLWHRKGASWRMAVYQEAPFWEPLRQLPPHVAFYTNKWVVVDFYTGHPTRPLTTVPSLDEVGHACALFILLGNPGMDAQLATWIRAFRDRGFAVWGQWEWATVYMPPRPSCAVLREKQRAGEHPRALSSLWQATAYTAYPAFWRASFTTRTTSGN